MTRAGCGRWALGRCRALDLRAARTRAGRALATGLVALGAVQNDGLRLGYATLEYIVAQIRDRRALSLEHVLT